MSILTRPLSEQELADAGIEPAPIAHETFSQLFAVDRGELEVLDPFSASPAEGQQIDDGTPPAPQRVGPAVWAWGVTMGAATGLIAYASVVTS